MPARGSSFGPSILPPGMYAASLAGAGVEIKPQGTYDNVADSLGFICTRIQKPLASRTFDLLGRSHVEK